MNRCIFIGRLCADPEIRATQSGTLVASYRLAVDRQYKRDGEQTADFIRCIAFGKGADFARDYLKKGMRIAIEGRLQTGSYEKDGATHYTSDIIVDRHEFCESRNSRSAETPAADYPQNAAPASYAQYMMPIDDDDLPF